jgi:5-formyltetrahydrofolate cyclo-ligase
LKNLERVENKNSLRQLFKQKREEFHINSKDATEDLSKNLLKILPKKSDKYWATYRAHKSEANPTAVESMVDISWCYPVVEGETLSFYPNEKSEWTLNQFKIEEPTLDNIQKSKKIELSQIEGVLLPGLAFDLKGQRLGFGKAFYDKTLKNYSGIKVGVAYSIQITESLPSTEHDIPVDVVVTEKAIFRIGSKVQERKIL